MQCNSQVATSFKSHRCLGAAALPDAEPSLPCTVTGARPPSVAATGPYMRHPPCRRHLHPRLPFLCCQHSSPAAPTGRDGAREHRQGARLLCPGLCVTRTPAVTRPAQPACAAGASVRLGAGCRTRSEGCLHLAPDVSCLMWHVCVCRLWRNGALATSCSHLWTGTTSLMAGPSTLRAQYVRSKRSGALNHCCQ